MLVRAEQSRAFARFCERVYGKNLTQFGTADMQQLEKLLAALALNERSRVLDVGCGIGATAEYISDLTGAKIKGIDVAEPVIERARERTGDKAGRLTFLVADLNDLDLPAETFDTVISVDTLYFAKDLAKTIRPVENYADARRADGIVLFRDRHHGWRIAGATGRGSDQIGAGA